MELTHTAQRSGPLSSFLRGEMGLSSGLMNKLKWEEKLLVNGTPQRTNYTVNPGDTITVLLDEPEPDYPPEDGPLDILLEDAHILVVDKPAGMLIHPSRARLTGTLANRVYGYYRRTGQRCAFHPVTRLDRDTFGLVLLAKNAHMHHILNDYHAQGLLEKTYTAWVLGAPEKDAGTVDAPIARLPLPSLLRTIDPAGKPAVTEYRVLRRGEVSLLELRPITGRTHQLRLHCAYLGCPILGDPQYGGEKCMAWSQRLGLTGQQLCASRLRFSHPVTGEMCTVFSRIPFEIPGNK